ncbi:MFS transporter [Aeromicrobium sp. 50.2.37]|uniref:MFS transporter n=1 Tax=Aeromicrobium sp. 50.2.37 TaxID=2969305 RepID=UPI00214FFFE3|nr:MFS transporter [Aeromicrobium sp. 50.2.37]MCR4513159.1 MFS transporter [Aeromicrobium sp. 50.2.37]
MTEQARLQRRILRTLVAVQVVGGVGNGAGLAVGVLLLREVSGSSGWAGMSTVMLTLGAALATVPLATLAVRAGRRPALATGWFLGAVGAAVVVLGADADSLLLVLVGLFLCGVSTASNLQSRFAAVDRAEPRHVGRSLALVTWATTVGAVLGPNLIGPGTTTARALGVPDLAGPLVFSCVAFAVAGTVVLVLLRPDPLPPAKRDGIDVPVPRVRAALPHVRGETRTAVVTIALAHAVMASVMALTPVHMQDHGAGVEVIGLTISLHIAGMYALSPVMGWLADRWGPARTILAGQLVLVAAVVVAGTSGTSEVRITVGLVLLGLGWSAATIAGAALLTRSTDPAVRPLVQGLGDLTMNLAGAAGGLLAGVLVAWQGFGTLNAVAGTLVVPVVLLVVAGRRAAQQVSVGTR